MSDNQYVSWETSELQQFAKTLGVPLWVVVRAKEESGLKDRAALKDLVLTNLKRYLNESPTE